MAAPERAEGCRVGEWRSLVAHLLWEQRVAGSNPVSPTIILDLIIQLMLKAKFAPILPVQELCRKNCGFGLRTA
jgi:hypothetical protein